MGRSRRAGSGDPLGRSWITPGGSRPHAPAICRANCVVFGLRAHRAKFARRVSMEGIRRMWGLFRRRPEEARVETLSRAEVAMLLELRSRELLGISGEEAIKLAEKGELPDDLTGSIVSSWVAMAKGTSLQSG
jgi:hypothetical protein